MRILYIAADAVSSPKGAGVRIRRTVESLVTAGHEVELFTPRRPDEVDSSVDIAASHTTVTLSGERFLDRMMSFRAEVADWLRDRRADVVQFRSIFEGVPAVQWARRTGAKVVFEAHGFPSIELPYHYPGVDPAAPVFDKLIADEQALLHQSDVVMTPSLTGRRFLLTRGLPADRIAVVPNAVDLDRFRPPVAPPPDRPPYRLVYVGTLAPWQGLSTVLEALARLRANEMIELHVVGPAKSRWRRALKAVAHRRRVHRMVHFAGAAAHEDLPPTLHTAHLCLAPLPDDPRNSVQGCCPLKVLEYMAAGRPILATRIPPLRELLVDGETARLTPPGSPAALAEAIDSMLRSPEERESLGRRAREVAEERFGPAPFQRRVAAVIDRLSPRAR